MIFCHYLLRRGLRYVTDLQTKTTTSEVSVEREMTLDFDVTENEKRIRETISGLTSGVKVKVFVTSFPEMTETEIRSLGLDGLG